MAANFMPYGREQVAGDITTNTQSGKLHIGFDPIDSIGGKRQPAFVSCQSGQAGHLRSD